MKKLASLMAGAVLASSAAMAPVDEAGAFWGSGWGGGPWGWGGYPGWGGWGGPWGWGGYPGWGYPGYGWGGWGYPGYGWGGWGYPGYGWGYPGYGWGYPAAVAPTAPATTQSK